jgi:hypothetical protein
MINSFKSGANVEVGGVMELHLGILPTHIDQSNRCMGGECLSSHQQIYMYNRSSNVDGGCG